MAHGPRFNVAIVIELPTAAGKVAALALTTEPGWNVEAGLKSKTQSESEGRRAMRSNEVAAVLSCASRPGFFVTSTAPTNVPNSARSPMV